MKNTFKILGITIIFFMTFIYSEKTVSVIKEYDDIMIELKSKIDSYNVDVVDAEVSNNGMIPGISGKKVNINKSYSKMKRYGSFNEKLIVYDKISPTISIYDNFKYPIISGHPSKNMVSLIFLVKDNNSINNIIELLEENDIKASFFIDDKYVEENSILIESYIKKEYNIGNYTNSSQSNYNWVDTIIKNIGKQSIGYCYIKDKNIKSWCIDNNDFIIEPTYIESNNLLIDVKKQLKSGSLIMLNADKKTLSELNLIINYINSKGLKITNLSNHIEE